MKTKILFVATLFVTSVIFSSCNKKQEPVKLPEPLKVISINQFSNIVAEKFIAGELGEDETIFLPNKGCTTEEGYNYGYFKYIEDTVNYKKLIPYHEKYYLPSVVYLCDKGSHLPILDDLNKFKELDSNKNEVYIIEKNRPWFKHSPEIVVYISDGAGEIYSWKIYDSDGKELHKRK